MRVQLTARRDRGEEGTVAIIVAMVAVLMIGILAFVTDFGDAYANERTLQNGVDAAVLAAGDRIIETSTPGQTCAQMISATTQSLAQDDARAAFSANGANGSTLNGNAISIRCDDPLMPDRVVIAATAKQTSPSFFGQLYGQNGYAIAKSATAVIGPAGTLVGVRPFAICDQLGTLADTSPNAYLTLDFDNADLGCGTASGNFGTLDIRYPAVNGSPGSLVDDWVRYGYSGALPVSAPISLNGSPGIPASNLDDDFQAILDQSIVLPTYDVRGGNGSNSTYDITGYVEVKLCGVKLTSGNGSLHPGTCFQSSLAPSGNNARFIQLQFVRFIPIGSLNPICKIDDQTCDPGTEVLKLAQ